MRGEVGSPVQRGRFLSPRTLQLDDPRITLESDTTARAARHLGRGGFVFGRMRLVDRKEPAAGG